MRVSAMLLLGSSLACLAGPAPAQSVDIPGVGRVRIPRVPTVPRGRGRQEPIVSVRPGTNSDGSIRCNASIDYPGYLKIRIIESKFTDRPPLTGFQGVAAGGIRGFWHLDYEVTPHIDRAYTFSVSFMGSRAVDSRGSAWGSMRNPLSDSGKLTEAGRPSRGQVTYISYDSDGRGISTMSPKLAGWLRAPGRRITDSYSRPADLVFPPIPANCTDEPVLSSAGSARVQPAGGVPLVRPRQVPKAGISRISAPAGTVREAVQIGFIWSYGEGVHPDFAQGLAWYREAERRQAAKRDFSMQNEIRLMLSSYAESNVLRLLELGIGALRRNSWQEAQYFFGRGAALGNAQAMAALGHVYGEGMLNPRMQFYWCRRGFEASRASRIQHERDAVNHFCPTATFDEIMTPQERRANPASIARARAKSGAIKRQHDAMAELAREWHRQAIIDGLFGSSGGGGGGGGGSGFSRDKAYAYGQGGLPDARTSGLYGNCHGGAFYGCPEPPKPPPPPPPPPPRIRP